MKVLGAVSSASPLADTGERLHTSSPVSSSWSVAGISSMYHCWLCPAAMTQNKGVSSSEGLWYKVSSPSTGYVGLSLLRAPWLFAVLLALRVPRAKRNSLFHHVGRQRTLDSTSAKVLEGLHAPHQEVHKAGPKRVYASGQSHHGWVSGHGFHWFLRQAHPHPNQQHPDGRIGLLDLG